MKQIKYYHRFFCLILIAITTVPVWSSEKETPNNAVFFIRDYGAVGDGKTLDTVAIQKTIDACAAAGGGTVRFTKGTWLSGSLFLKSRVHIQLDQNAVLLGSTRKEDYKYVDYYDRKYLNIPEDKTSSAAYLIYADGVENITIKGSGIIDGNGETFWTKPKTKNYQVWDVPSWRPRALICIVRSRFLTFQDITLRNSPTYTIWTMKCEDLAFHHLTIKNPIYGPNTDGLDIDCCRRVVISDCNITGGDDSVAIKSDSGPFGAEEFACEDISVSNCVFCAGPACGVRIGYEGDSIIRNCSFSNITIWNSDLGIDLVSILPPPRYSIKHGSRIENITFSNLTMRNVGNPIHFWLNNQIPLEKPTIYMRNISISNMVAECSQCCYIGGYADQNIEKIYLSNIRLIPTGTCSPELPATALPNWKACLPYVFYCSMVDHIYINDLTIDWSKAGNGWKYGLFFHKAKNVNLSSIFSFGGEKQTPLAAVGFDESQGRLWNSGITDKYPLLQGQNGSDIFMNGCDFNGFPNAVLLDKTSKLRHNQEK